MLDALDPATSTGRTYTALVAHPHASTTALATILGLPEEEVGAALSTLVTAGLATRRDDAPAIVWEAEPPERSVDTLLESEELRLAAARRAGQQLSRLYWMARRETAHYPGLEVVREVAQIQEHARVLHNMAKSEVRSLNRPPFLTHQDEAAVQAQIEQQRTAIAAGVVHKAIWWDGVFKDPAVSAVAIAMMGNGEQARILGDVPMKMIIADDQRAMVPLDPNDLTDGATLVIHPSGLLTALISIFDTLWTVAAPISGAGRSAELTEQERVILTLMVAGVTDDAIARRLNISRRTVLRHITGLFERLGATTRFQAGAQAVRRGWL